MSTKSGLCSPIPGRGCSGATNGDGIVGSPMHTPNLLNNSIASSGCFSFLAAGIPVHESVLARATPCPINFRSGHQVSLKKRTSDFSCFLYTLKKRKETKFLDSSLFAASKRSTCRQFENPPHCFHGPFHPPLLSPTSPPYQCHRQSPVSPNSFSQAPRFHSVKLFPAVLSFHSHEHRGDLTTSRSPCRHTYPSPFPHQARQQVIAQALPGMKRLRREVERRHVAVAPARASPRDSVAAASAARSGPSTFAFAFGSVSAASPGRPSVWTK